MARMQRTMPHATKGLAAAVRPSSRRQRLAAPTATFALALAAYGFWSSSPGAATAAFTAVIARPAAPKLQSAHARGDPEGMVPRPEVSNEAERQEEFRNVTAQIPQEGEFGRVDGNSPIIAHGPHMSTCFVEYEEAGRPVLEEWTMRAKHGNVDAFRAWRQQGTEPMSVRCMDASVKAGDYVVCLECMSHSGAQPHGSSEGSAALAVVKAQVVMTFADLQQCFASTVGGMGFCKSGRVVMPM